MIKFKKSVAVIMSIILAVGGTSLYSANSIKAATNEYVYDASTDSKTVGKCGTDNFFELTGTVSSKTGAVQLAKNEGGALEFTTTGTANVVIGASSTSDTNKSDVALYDSNGNAVEDVTKNTTITVAGAKSTEITWKGLPAGSYKVVAPKSGANGSKRGTNIKKCTVTLQTADSESPVTTLGAAYREETPEWGNGVRFGAQFDLTKNITKSGTLVALKDTMDANGVKELTESQIDVVCRDVERTKYISKTETTLEYAVAIINIPEDKKSSVIVSRPYVIIDGTYYFGEQLEASYNSVEAKVKQ